MKGRKLVASKPNIWNHYLQHVTKSSPDCKETLESLLESIVPFLNFGFFQKKSQSALHLMIFLGFTFLKMQSAVNENGRQNKFPLGANRVRCRIFIINPHGV